MKIRGQEEKMLLKSGLTLTRRLGGGVRIPPTHASFTNHIQVRCHASHLDPIAWIHLDNDPYISSHPYM